MLRTSGIVLVGSLLMLFAGCCDSRHSRKIVIIDHQGNGSDFYADHIEVDTSLLGDGAVESRKDQNATWWCYEPKTVMHISPKAPIKILIVPASQPTAR
jgi:hypothetical protein